MRASIEGYRNFPGRHCGSVAMRGLLHHYCGLGLPEAVVFGLGSGLDCLFLRSPEMTPAAVVFGRSATMEVDCTRALGVDYAEQTDPDDAHAWEVVREEVLAGRPTMLTGDILYLDYREFKVHFPGHRFVLLGFDDDRKQVTIADRIREEPEVCSTGALAQSRNPPEGLSTQNLWGRFGGGAVANDPTEACRIAIGRCARRMLGEGEGEGLPIASGGSTRIERGVAGIRALAAAIPGWAGAADAPDTARYNAGCIEKFGNGGGNFRRLYAEFLGWARERDPDRVPGDAASLAWQAADGWTRLSECLAAAAGGEDAWNAASHEALRVADLEERLFERLARNAGRDG